MIGDCLVEGMAIQGAEVSFSTLQPEKRKIKMKGAQRNGNYAPQGKKFLVASTLLVCLWWSKLVDGCKSRLEVESTRE